METKLFATSNHLYDALVLRFPVPICVRTLNIAIAKLVFVFQISHEKCSFRLCVQAVMETKLWDPSNY
jgi:hypothetical protein